MPLQPRLLQDLTGHAGQPQCIYKAEYQVGALGGLLPCPRVHPRMGMPPRAPWSREEPGTAAGPSGLSFFLGKREQALEPGHASACQGRGRGCWGLETLGQPQEFWWGC